MSNQLLRSGQAWNQDAITILNHLLGTALPADTAAAITAAIAALKSTGWGAPTGTATRTAFATTTVTTELLAQRVKALIDDLTTRGILGA